MITIRSSASRGSANQGWLESKHTFSFADYLDQRYMGFRSLRVINEDIIEGGAGFPPHGHKEMEIISYVITGSLEHKDSMGNSYVIKPGEIQRMSAGTGIRHSEYNFSKNSKSHFLQIWIYPNSTALEPSYEHKDFSHALENNPLVLLASREGVKNSIRIHQDVFIYGSKSHQGFETSIPMDPQRHPWIQMICGQLTVNNETILKAGDAAAISEEKILHLSSTAGSEFLIFDLA
jgi:redox-sensitive bicupin YhaK (pirin superfamily)